MKLKARLSPFVIWLQILLLAFSTFPTPHGFNPSGFEEAHAAMGPSGPTATFSPAPVPSSPSPSPGLLPGSSPGPGANQAAATPAPLGDCSQACDGFNKAKISQDLACNPHATPRPGNIGLIQSNNTTYSDYGSCASDFDKRWGDLGHHCQAKELLEKGRDLEISTATIYTAAAAVCTTACGMLMTGVGVVAAPNTIIACTVTGVAATVLDLSASIKLSLDGASFSSWWEQNAISEAGYVPGMAGSAVGVGAAAYSQVGVRAAKATGEIARKGAELAAKQAMKKGTQLTVEGAAKRAGEEAGKKAAQEAGAKAAQTTAQKALVCATMALFIATAAIKWANYENHKKNAVQECETIQTLRGFGPAVLVQASPTPKPSPKPLGTSDSTGVVSFGPTSTLGSTQDDGTMKYTSAGAFPATTYAAAMAGSTGKMFDSMPNKDKIPEVLKDLGTDLNSLEKKLQSSSPGAAISGMIPNLPESIQSTLSNLDDLARQGKLQMGNEVASAIMQGGGGGGGMSGGGSEISFGARLGASRGTGPTAGVTSEATFEKQKVDTASLANGDIWHGDWKESLFEIVSIRTNQVLDRVEQLEWASPLNRAYQGLSNRSLQIPIQSPSPGKPGGFK